MRGFFFVKNSSKMILSQTNCKQIFKDAYENRYTWPKSFNGYQGKCIYISENEKIEGNFKVEKTFKPQITNISDDHIVKMIGSQLFEIVIHRVKKSFDEIHSKNDFHLESNTENGIQMIVTGKNEGDKYRVKDRSINMVYRRIHGIIIEIFVERFFDTNKGLLSQKYSSIQLDQKTLKPISQRLYYDDHFLNIGSDFWALSSRTINYLEHSNEEKQSRFVFEEMSLLD